MSTPIFRNPRFFPLCETTRTDRRGRPIARLSPLPLDHGDACAACRPHFEQLAVIAAPVHVTL